jgi:hypothetical protein
MKASPSRGGGKGSGVHGSERLSPTTDRAEKHPVDVFAPASVGEDRALRIRLHRARDTATARATYCKHSKARVIYWLAADLASDWVFRRGVPLADLQEVHATLVRMFMAACSIERLVAPDA